MCLCVRAHACTCLCVCVHVCTHEFDWGGGKEGDQCIYSFVLKKRNP